MPMEWLHALASPSTKDKPSLLMKLKYEMTIADVYDLLEYQEYEKMVNYEEYVRSQKSNRGSSF